MKNLLKATRIYGVFLLVCLVATSCLKDQWEEEENAEQRKIDAYVKQKGFTDADKLKSGIYLKFYGDTAITSGIQKPKTGQTLIVNFTGMYTDGTILETTDKETGEDASALKGHYIVYGPQRLKAGYTLYGFDTTIRYFSPGDTGTMLIPSKYAWYDYNPLVYHVKLIDIIENDSAYEANQFQRFINANDFDTAIKLYKGVYWKTTSGSLADTAFTYTSSDSAVIELTARYAETYYADSTGRVFYPLASAPLKTKRLYGGELYFPFVSAIDSALKHMAIGDSIEICGLSGIAYGDDGFNDPYYGRTIVPPYMPVHYKIKLITVIREEEE